MEKINRVSMYFDEARETMPVDKLEVYFNERVKNIVEYSYEKSPKIREIMKRTGLAPQDIQNTEQLRRFPIIRKDDLVKYQKDDPPFGGFVTQPIKSIERIYVSPGPIHEPHSQSLVKGYMQAFYNGGIHGGDIVLNTWSYHMVPAGCCMDEALRAIGAVVIPSGVGNTELQVEIMRDLKVTAFCGTTGFLMAIIKKAEEMGYSFKEDFCLEVAVAGGEMGGGPIRDLCENKYGLITSDFYGTVDVGVLAYECRERSGMHFTTDAFVEIVDSKTGNRLGPGEIGEVAATSFNEVYPLIRFGTGDLSYYENQPCLCGRTTPKLGKIVGRVGDAVRIRGMFVHKNQLDLAFQGFPEVSKYQIVVDRQEYRDTLAVRLELKKENIDKVNFKEKLGKKIQEICILKPDEIEIFKEGSLPEGYRVLQDNRKY